MKNKIFIYTICASLGMAAMQGCERSLEPYGYDRNGASFTDTLTNFSFVYGPVSTVQDTVWVNLATMGFLSDDDRPIAFEQVPTTGANAVAGKHYVAFDDPQLQKYYVVKGGANAAKVPFVLKRDASLQSDDYTLLIRVKQNGYFGSGALNQYGNGTTARIIISDKLTQPSNWNTRTTRDFGPYGKAKHRWLIEQTKDKWDYDYLYNILGYTETSAYTNENYDSGYIAYYRVLLQQLLDAYNAEQGTDLKEADGTKVVIVTN